MGTAPEAPISVRLQQKGQVERLRGTYEGDAIPVWGVTPGQNEINVGKWQKIAPGDVALLTGNGHIFAAAGVTGRLRCRPLALDLWGEQSDRQTWEYLYFLTPEIVAHNIPYEAFNRVVGYKRNYVPNSFSVLDEEKSRQALLAFDFDLASDQPPVTDELEEAYEAAITRLEALAAEGSFDQSRERSERVEQGFLRRSLVGGQSTISCALCAKEYPADLIVTAHVKPRRACSLEEKKDVSHIVVPMCQLGCDAVYENGYVYVHADGYIRKRPAAPITEAVEAYRRRLAGRKCSGWNEDRKPYFDWHRQHVLDS